VQQPPEVRLANLAFMLFWMLAVAAILLAGQRWSRLRGFRDGMVAQWKPALAIALLYLVSYALSGRGFFNPYALAIFCQALLGLALVRRIAGYEPLPVTQSVVQRQHIWRSVGLMLGISILLAAVAFLLGSIGLGIVQQIFGEVNRSAEAASSLTYNKWQLFFTLLAGAGIAEETTYRLVALSLLWKLTTRRWLAIVVSALLFAAYHLSPLDGMYLTFWKYPISQFLASSLIGLVWGYAYARRGYETAVLSHTLSDWVPILLFLR
jgi:membrane protease YdiL (CAAX protease family)